ncbi:MAG: VWA domain-containing protein [Candidatus Riflebacteria bacterium]|nr:VWA domain-containing protein [Candidatus Riflebacteria bacterium]
MKHQNCILKEEKTGKEVALKAVAVKGELTGLTCHWQIVQKFVNAEKKAIEALYVFPLPADATLSGLKIVTGDKTIVTRPEERDKAFEEYDEAISAGNGAFMLDQERRDIFALNLGNLLPGQEVEVQISMFQLLQAHATGARVAFPVALVPKYFPNDKTADITEWERVQPGYATEVPYGFSYSLKIVQNSPIKSVESPGHPIRVAYDTNVAEVTLAQVNAMPDSDVIVSFELAERFKPMLSRAFFNDREHVLFEVFPEFGDQSAVPVVKEVVFIVDCSGSMEGDSIREARNALQLCLRSLNQGDTFQVYCFGGSWRQLFKEPQTFGDTSFKTAAAAIAKIDADMGGTEILPALSAAIKSLRHEFANIILFTDGAVGNEDEVINLAAAKKGRCRIFSFGIGNGASEHLIKGVADATGGRAEFVFPGERIEPKVLRQFNRLNQATLSDVNIVWGKEDVEAVPDALPAIFAGEVVRFAARLGVGKKLPAKLKVELSAQYDGKQVSWSTEKPVACSAGVPALWWAQQRINELEGGEEELAPGSRQKRQGPPKSETKMVKLSKAYGLICSQTSLIGIEERSADTKNDGRPELRKIPVMVPAHRDFMASIGGGLPSGIALGAVQCASAPSSFMSKAYSMVGDFMYSSRAVVCEGIVADKSKQAAKNKRNAKNRPDAEDKLVEILMHAGADGSFAFSEELLKLLGVTVEEFEDWLAKAPASLIEAQKRDCAMTLLVRHQLETFYAERKNMWSAIAGKMARRLQNWQQAVAV